MARPRLSPPLGLIVLVEGMGTLGAEIAAARLLAPYFGASTVIWANTIGVVLVALSLGYWLGGRRADRDPTLDGLARLVLVGAALLAALPFVADPFLHAAVGALDAISVGAFAGSLVAVLVLVAAPVFVLGMVAPYAVRLAVERVDATGTTAGRLYALSTIGSLIGNFASALLLIPLIGTRRTFLVFSLLLMVTGVLALSRRRRALALAPAAVAVLLALPVGTVKATGGAARVIHEADTQYQYARVVEEPGGDRYLELNEGQAVHSLRRVGTYLTGGYWDELLVAPFAVRDAATAGPPGRVAILGDAAGTTARAYGHFFGGTHVDGVELDGELTAIGRRWFDLRGPRLRTFTADARPYLRTTRERYDVIVVDAYRQPYIPFYLATREFFALARARLRPGGVVLVNVGHPEGDDRLERVLSATMAAVFGTVARDPAERVNTILIGTDAPGGASGARLAAALPRLPAEVRPRAAAAAGRIAPRLPGGEVYTDDRAPVEWLIDASIVQVAARGAR